MRIWSLHPKYLDSKGLVAVWREALLAKKVLEGKTKGYKNHPQLRRFKNSQDSNKYINAYLQHIWEEANRRKYSFNKNKFKNERIESKIKITQGQVNFEFEHLLKKVQERDKEFHKKIKDAGEIEVHPIFKKVAGEIEEWERLKQEIYTKKYKSSRHLE